MPYFYACGLTCARLDVESYHSVESVYSLSILGDNKSRWAMLLERVEFYRIGRTQGRGVKNVAIEVGHSLHANGYYGSAEIRIKCGT